MFNRIKRLAKKVVNKIKEVVKYISEKIEENIIMEEVVELKKMELVIDAAKSAANSIVDASKTLAKAIYDHPVVFIGSTVGVGVGVGVSIIIDKKFNSKAYA